MCQQKVISAHYLMKMIRSNRILRMLLIPEMTHKKHRMDMYGKARENEGVKRVIITIQTIKHTYILI